MTIDHDELERLLAAAPQAPWVFGINNDIRCGPLGNVLLGEIEWTQGPPNCIRFDEVKPAGELVVALRNAAPALVQRSRLLDELRGELVRFDELLEHAVGGMGRSDALHLGQEVEEIRLSIKGILARLGAAP